MRTLLRLVVGVCLTTALGCTGPDREAFPEDPTGTTSADTTSSTGSSPTSGSTTAGASNGGGDPGAGAGGTGPGPGGGEGGNPGNGGGGNGPVGPGGNGGGGNGGSGGSGGGTTSGGGGGAGPVCDPVGNACLPAVPGGGWVGPVALFEVGPADPLPACNLTGWPTALGDYFGELDEGAAVCDCDCEGAAGIVCTGNASYCGRGNFGQCETVCSAIPIAPGACVPAVSPVYLSVFAPTPVNAGSCAPAPTVALPTPQWGVKARACQGATTTPEGCAAGERCAPRPNAGEICIVQAGDVACPGDGWTAKHVRHTSFANTRSCSACTCGSAASTCGGQITFTDANGTNCGDESFFVDEVNAGACSALEDAQYMQYDYAPSGTCSPQGGVLSGDVTVDGTATYCCVE